MAQQDPFDNTLVDLAAVAKALAHPARLAILQTLARRGACICGEIVEVMPLAQSTVSQHLKELKAVGLVQGEIEGRRSCYCLDDARLEQVAQTLGAFLHGLAPEHARLPDRAPVTLHDEPI